MLEQFNFQRKLKRLQRGRAQVKEDFDRKIAAARKSRASRDEIYQLQNDQFFFLRSEDVGINVFVTDYYTDQAERLLVPIPRRDTESFEFDEGMQEYILRPEALASLRKAIRDENREFRDRWIAILTSTTGVLGTIIGILALLFDKVL